MDIEFHYYITAFIAHASGFDKAETHTIAQASQLVDENDIIYNIKDKTTDKTYSNYISQTMNIIKPKHKLIRIYPVFHFIPGDPLHHEARRTDGKMHLLNTTPDNEIARDMISLALKAPDETRLYRTGIATHAFADTWAHQNFVGWFDYFNNIGLDPKPDIGHANAEHHPDWVAHSWDDIRLTEENIDNNKRFITAASRIYDFFSEYNNSRETPPRISRNRLVSELIDTFGHTSSGDSCRNRDKRITAYRKLLPWLPDFDEKAWFDNAIDTEIRGLEDSTNDLIPTLMKDGYAWKENTPVEKTQWFAFQESIKEHQSIAMEKLRPTFSKMNIDLHQY